MNSDSDQTHWLPERLTIVGVGLLGGSVGLAVKALRGGYGGVIAGVGRRQSSLDKALALGCVDQGYLSLRDAVEAGLEAASHLLIIATPLSRFTGVFEELAACEADHLTITDVGSVKQPMCLDATRLLPEPWRFVSAHPMAGSEKGGVENAFAELLRGKVCVITPTPANQQGEGLGVLQQVEGFWRLLGMRLTTLTPAEHDRQAAAISHLPHAVAALLMEHAAAAGALDMASTGLRDTTRLASGDPVIWRDIFTTNREPVLQALATFADQIRDLQTLLRDGSDDDLEQWLARVKADRNRWLQGESGSDGR